MTPLLVALVALAVSGALAAATFRSPKLSCALGTGGCVTAAVVGLPVALSAFLGGRVDDVSLPWSTIPGGAFHLGVDSLSGFFLVPVFLVSALTALFGGPFLLARKSEKPVGVLWLFFNALVAGMVVVVTARNVLLFLVAWEVMSLAGFFLISHDDEKPDVRRAGWLYLAATHVGMAFLLPLFVGMSGPGSTLEFAEVLRAAHMLPRPTANLCFLLAVVGFGVKAGVVPFHVWLPPSYPAAPSHLPAVLSGAMSKIAIYGLVRVLIFLSPPPVWWAWTLIALGLLSGLVGILNSLAQHDLKKLLAYSSVENIGIILLGLGIGLLGQHLGGEAGSSLALLGFGGAMLHVLNHAVCKSLLFLSAAGVEHYAGTTQIDRLGGLMKRVPLLGVAFLIGALAIVGLPPLNGFSSEFLIYLGAFESQIGQSSALAALSPITVLSGLAVIGGLAAVAFAKAIGMVFLGTPREPLPTPKPLTGLMVGPLAALAAGCVTLGLAAPLVVGAMGSLLGQITGQAPLDAAAALEQHVTPPMTFVIVASAAFVTILGGLIFLRSRLLEHREIREVGTWDCGYARPTERMQYTGSSFVEPLTTLLKGFFRTREARPKIADYFPANQRLTTDVPDVATETVYLPLVQRAARLLARGKILQSGHVHLYVLYIAVTLLVLLVVFLGLSS
jgi:formate hydrogenlyase subunit 3/multisubunit Na+/H+ antiporter MnhD subunit